MKVVSNLLPLVLPCCGVTNFWQVLIPAVFTVFGCHLRGSKAFDVGPLSKQGLTG